MADQVGSRRVNPRVPECMCQVMPLVDGGLGIHAWMETLEGRRVPIPVQHVDPRPPSTGERLGQLLGHLEMHDPGRG